MDKPDKVLLLYIMNMMQKAGHKHPNPTFYTYGKTKVSTRSVSE